MEALGLRQHFSAPNIGGFGSDYCSNQLDDLSIDRAEFIRVAIRKAVASSHLSGAPRVVHFGDTPNDVRAALAAGALPVGLGTGAYTLAQLRASAGGQHALFLDDLSDTAAVMTAIMAA